MSGDESKGANLSDFEQKFGLNVFVDYEAGFGSEYEVMRSLVDLDDKDGVLADAESKISEFLVFNEKKVEVDGFDGLFGGSVEGSHELGCKGEILFAIVDGNAKDVDSSGNSGNACFDSLYGHSVEGHVELGIKGEILCLPVDENVKVVNLSGNSGNSSFCGLYGLSEEGNEELGREGEILCLSVDEKVEDVRLRGNSGSGCIIQPNDGACNDNQNANGDVEEWDVSPVEIRVGIDELTKVMEDNENRESYLVSDLIEVECERDEESSESELKELDEDTSSEESSSSSSYLSSSDDEEGGELDNDDENLSEDVAEGDDQLHKCISKQLQVAEDGKMEEGSMKDGDIEEMAFGSDDEVVKGPIKSKNEVEVLPPVPKVEVSLEQHHQTLPVGVILSILDNKVIIEGSYDHDPLNEGSIIWVTESRTPLGFIDEIFGPVKNPYYIVRFNSDKEIPGEISVGCAVSFVQEFASYVLNKKDLYKKGYDASGDNDEELDDELEFSDDEKEALYKQSLRQAKRGCQQSSNSMTGKRANHNHSVMNKSTLPSEGIVAKQRQTSVPSGSVPRPVAAGNFGSFRAENSSSNVNAMNPSFNIASQTSCCLGNLPQLQPNAFWLNGFPHQQQQNLFIQGQVMNILGSHPQQSQFIPNGMPFQQPVVPGSQFPANTPWPGGFLTPSVQSAPFGVLPSVSSPFFPGNFGHAPFGSNCMQQQVNSVTSDQQSPRLPRPATMIGEPSPPMQINQGRGPPMLINQGKPRFRGGRRFHHRGGRHSSGRGGHAGNQ